MVTNLNDNELFLLHKYLSYLLSGRLPPSDTFPNLKSDPKAEGGRKLMGEADNIDKFV